MSPFFAATREREREREREKEGEREEESINESCGVLFPNGRLDLLAFLLSSSSSAPRFPPYQMGKNMRLRWGPVTRS